MLGGLFFCLFYKLLFLFYLMYIGSVIGEAMRIVQKSCVSECKALCCRSGVTDMSPNEVDLVCGEKRLDLERAGNLLLLDSGDYRLLFNNNVRCPSLVHENGKAFCNIHNNPDKPSMCGDYPFFIDSKAKVVNVMTNCPVVLGDELKPFLRRITNLGYEVRLVSGCLNNL